MTRGTTRRSLCRPVKDEDSEIRTTGSDTFYQKRMYRYTDRRIWKSKKRPYNRKVMSVETGGLILYDWRRREEIKRGIINNGGFYDN